MNNNPVEINLTYFASLEDITRDHADAFGEGDGTQAAFDGVSTKLKDLGYDVLINHREKAEFVPSSRLSEVVSQREAFKTQAESALKELNALKTQSGLSEEAQTKIGELISQNEGLLSELQTTSVHLEIMGSASDAINPKDILPFIDMSKIKTDKNGRVTSGVVEEVSRIRTEKPYLFGGAKTGKSQGGFDPTGSGAAGGSSKADMNAAIRRAAFGSTRTF